MNEFRPGFKFDYVLFGKKFISVFFSFFSAHFHSLKTSSHDPGCTFSYVQLTTSIGYSKWVSYLTDPSFNASTVYAGISGLGSEYTMKDFEESLVINVMAAILVGLAIVMPLLMMHPRFRSRPQGIVTVTHEHF